MKVVLYPTETEKLTGTTSSIGWNNPKVVAAINHLFNVMPYERIVQLEVDNDQLTARFEPVPKDVTSGEVTKNV